MSAIRTFIAAELSDEVRSQICGAIVRLRECLEGVRWVATENLHLTFKFLGNVEPDHLERVLCEVEGVARGSAPFVLSFSGLGVFPNVRRPRVIWVGVDDGSDDLIAIQKAVETALVRRGFPKDDKPFRPHLTVGRVRSKRPTPDLAALLSDIEVRPSPQMITHVSVFRSDLTPNGPIYKALARYELSGRRDNISLPH